MIDIRKLKELVRLMVANDLTELDLRDTEEQVTLRRPSPHQAMVAPPMPVVAPANHAPGFVAAAPAGAAPEPPAPADGATARIESPMVGTFYDKPSPDAAVFVTSGTHVGPDTVVCLIEAMKIFNEIKAECSGTIRKILVKPGDSVEFGQALFEVVPD